MRSRAPANIKPLVGIPLDTGYNLSPNLDSIILNEGAGYKIRNEIWKGAEPTFQSTKPTWQVGRDGPELKFANATDYFAFPGDQLQQFTTESFIKMGSTVTSGEIYRMNEGSTVSGTYERQLSITGNSAFRFYVYSGGTYAVEGPINQIGSGGVGKYYHIVGVLNSTTMYLYVNGTLTGSLAAPGAYNGYGSPYSILGNSFDGSIVYVRRWSRALTHTEVWSLYTNRYQMYSEPRRRSFMPVAAAGGATNWGPLLSLQNNRLVGAY